MRAFFAVVLVSVSYALVAEDEVTSLPGWDAPLPSKQFSGYLDIGNKKKHLHYWLIKAEASATVDPSTAPTVLWLVSSAHTHAHGPLCAP